MSKVDSVQFYIDLLSIAKEFDFTDKLQNRIVNHLLSEYRNDELAWDTMARRELEGFSYSAHTADDAAIPPAAGGSLTVTEKKKTSLKVINCVIIIKSLSQLKYILLFSNNLQTKRDQNSILIEACILRPPTQRWRMVKMCETGLDYISAKSLRRP